MALVPKFNKAGIAPFSLGGQSRWTNMMWLEFLFDRIGGPEVFQAVFDGEKDAWSNPASIKALTEIQKLIKAGGFIKGFSSITADSNADQALLFTGKAAMMLHGTWTYGSMSNDGGDFVSGGHLGYSNFPPVAGGTGDPSNTVGNPGQYYSISSKATAAEKDVAKNFFKTAVSSDAESKEWVAAGAIPIVNGSDSLLTGQKDEDWLKFVYGVASGAKTFAQSWDQALEPHGRRGAAGQHRQAVPAVHLAPAVRRQHEQGHRHVTTVAPATLPAPAAPASRRRPVGPARSRGWRCRRCSSSSRSA